MNTYTILISVGYFPHYMLYKNKVQQTAWENTIERLFTTNFIVDYPIAVKELLDINPSSDIRILCTFQTDQDPHSFLLLQHPELFL